MRLGVPKRLGKLGETVFRAGLALSEAVDRADPEKDRLKGAYTLETRQNIAPARPTETEVRAGDMETEHNPGALSEAEINHNGPRRMFR